MFRQPLGEKEVIRATRSAETVYKDQNKDYKYKNETLINLLEISDIEQKEMLTIISKEEYKRRNNEYNKKKYKNKLEIEGKLTKKQQLEAERKKIKSLIEQGFSLKDISEKLNIPYRTIQRRAKELRNLLYNI